MTYRERLWPAPWVFLSTALVIPASLLVFLPINITAGIICALVLYAGTTAVLIASSPSIQLDATHLTAGRARIPVVMTGEPGAFAGEDARLERGQRLDARAWLVIRGWVDPVVKIPIIDPSDPTPYWLVSTRHPKALCLAIESLRAR